MAVFNREDLIAAATAFKSEGDNKSAYRKVRTVLLERHPEFARFDEPRLSRRVSEVLSIAVLAGYLYL